MQKTRVLFCDVGGVLLTNGWERPAREKAAEHFGLDSEDFQQRHETVVSDFETGRMTLDEYLQKTVFFDRRPFTSGAFKDFMWEQSQPYPEALAFMTELARSQEYVLAALNNESKELNQYRIARFRLTDFFTLFFSSCYVGVRKPDPKIYLLALEVMQRRPEESLFIDDRISNVESARALGMHAIHYLDVAQLRAELHRLDETPTEPRQ